jgi:hypothetical protein
MLGKPFGASALQAIREEIRLANPKTRAEIARRICERLEWKNPLGRAQVMTARVALLRLHRTGRIELPPPRNGNGNGGGLTRQTVRVWPEPIPVNAPAHELTGLRLSEVSTKSASALWNALIARYHYLGFTPLAGAQKRYLIEWDGGLLGAIGFAAAAWKVGCRDQYIGWRDKEVRAEHLHLVANNSRFLILPWVHSPNLASKVLSMSARVLPTHFQRSYGYRPVLLETFVESARFTGSCYRAANWLRLGSTQGRGRCDRFRTSKLPIKDIWIYPLRPDFRKLLGGE